MTNTNPTGPDGPTDDEDTKEFELPKEFLAAVDGQTIDLSDVTISSRPTEHFPSAQFRNESMEAELELTSPEGLPTGLALNMKYENGIRKKKAEYEKRIEDAKESGIKLDKEQCGILIFEALLSGDHAISLEEVRQTGRANYQKLGLPFPEGQFNVYCRHLLHRKYCTALNTKEAASEPALHSLSNPTRIPGSGPAEAETRKPAETVQGDANSIRMRVINKLKIQNRAPLKIGPTELEKSKDIIDLTDDNKKQLITLGMEVVRRANSAGTTEDRIATVIITTLMNEDIAHRDAILQDIRETIASRLPIGEEWNDETFYKVWNQIAAVGQDAD